MPIDPAEPNDATPFLPDRRSLKALREAAAGCRGCHLWREATQTVFGEGRRNARLMLIGETAGDREDLAGKPFVGPAGRELDKALARVGIDRRDTYVTNVVKHFKFKRQGKRRLHRKPGKYEIDACLPWLEAELDLVEPDGVGLLGATAAQTFLGSRFRLTAERGRLLDVDLAPIVMATVHPSSILRAPGDEARHDARAAFVRDLEVLAEAIKER